MHVVFCVDRAVLPGLHVAAYSLLKRISPDVDQTSFFVFSDEFDEKDVSLLRESLASLKKPFTVELRRLDAAALKGFPPLNGSHAPYYRLIAAQAMEVDRFLYVDADTLCDVDVGDLQLMDMGSAPAAWVAEAPLARAVDRRVAEQLGNSETEPYYNSGVILVNVAEWRKQRITEKAMEYLATNHPLLYDQSALNFVLYGKAIRLDERFNCIANMRTNWPYLRQPQGQVGRLVHFVDYPKPWDLFGEWVHPQYPLWRSALDKTAVRNFRSWQPTPVRKFPKDRKAWKGYKKIIKDRCLFAGYACGWLKKVKGVPSVASLPAVATRAL